MDVRKLIHDQVQSNLVRAHKKHERSYNTRARNVDFQVGQEVYRRSYEQSNFEKSFNVKLAKKWVKARIVRRIGSALYELSDMKGNGLKQKYHAKDLKQ